MKFEIRADNSELAELLRSLQRAQKPFWKSIGYELAKPRRKRNAVNISKIDKYAVDNATIVVPGKVLGTGVVSKKYTIAAFSFSDSAKTLIAAAGGKITSIKDLYAHNPEAKDLIMLK